MPRRELLDRLVEARAREQPVNRRCDPKKNEP